MAESFFFAYPYGGASHNKNYGLCASHRLQIATVLCQHFRKNAFILQKKKKNVTETQLIPFTLCIPSPHHQFPGKHLALLPLPRNRSAHILDVSLLRLRLLLRLLVAVAGVQGRILWLSNVCVQTWTGARDRRGKGAGGGVRGGVRGGAASRVTAPCDVPFIDTERSAGLPPGWWVGGEGWRGLLNLSGGAWELRRRAAEFSAVNV